MENLGDHQVKECRLVTVKHIVFKQWLFVLVIYKFCFFSFYFTDKYPFSEWTLGSH